VFEHSVRAFRKEHLEDFNLRRRICSILSAAGMLVGLSLLSVPASAQRGGGAPQPEGCPGPPQWQLDRQAAQAAARGGAATQAQGAGRGAPAAATEGAVAAPAAGRGGRGGGRGGNQPAAALPPVPRFPNEPAYGVQAGKPDFGGLDKGVWNVPYIVNLQVNAHDEKGCQFIYPPFKPAAKAIWEERFLKNDMKDDPEGFCLPPGVPRMLYTPYPTQIYQMPDRIVFVYEGGAHVWRLVWMDGRKLPNPDDVNPTYLGYSVGHWEGDTLVIESLGFNDRTWLDASGHPHGEKLRVTEKLTRTDFNNIKVEATFDDPDYYTKPWVAVTGITWAPNRTGPFTMRGGEILEYICQENNRDLIHLNAQPGK
jgi:hypothetical protein